ncbi:tetratricopeptide repeat protein [Maricaulis sp.]|uniref:tetratricopeptide repeat protein n=1 Tax=Maricaulis sp. TaxID=1486257 RepID=UPI0025BDB3E0|nr:tetratricopeptide repeat protein [Maricaulis sp.]
MRLSALLVASGLLVLSNWTATAFAQPDPDASECAAGQAAMDRGENDEAIRLFRDCLDHADLDMSQEIAAYAALGAALLAEREFQEALEAYNFAFAIVETRGARVIEPTLYRNRGIARSELGQPERALEDLQTAAAAAPNDTLTQITLGVVYQALDRDADAVVAFDNVVRLEPDWIGAWINRAGALLDVGLTRAAVEDARRAVELAPEDGSTLNMLCWTLIKDDRAETALPLCEQAVAAEPDTGAIVHSYATALEAVGRLDEARSLFRRAWRLNPDDPEILHDYERTNNP